MSSPAILPSDGDARRRALTPDTSFLVQAPAGSGKTSLLTQRFLRLLAIAEQPEEILAITFTRKAAAEMRTRILGELRAASRNTPVTREYERQSRALAEAALARDRERGWGILESPQRLRIQTMDAFQASLVARLPWLSRFGMTVESTERPKAIYLEAVRQTLTAMAQGPERESVVAVLNLFDNKMDVLSESLAKLVAQRDQWRSTLGANLFAEQSPRQVRATLENGMRRVLEMELGRLRAQMPSSVQGSMARCAKAAAAAHPDAAVGEVLAGITGWPDATADSLPQWRTLADWLLTDKCVVRKRVDKNLGFPSGCDGKRPMEELLADLALEPGFAEALCATRDLPEPVYGDAEWRVLEALLRFMSALLPRLWLQFGLRGETDFTEVSLRALDALEDESGGPTLLAERLDARIQHVLVDEFQDTSVLQMQLLRKLTENWIPGDGRTLFLVGDPMQSIYYWRNARVDLFLRAWGGELDGLPRLETLQLTRNFRSRRGLIEAFNSFFAAQFPAANNAEQGAVRYADAEGDAGEAEEAQPRVHCQAFLCTDQTEEAAWIASEVARIQAEDADRPEPRSIGILFRAKNQARAVGMALQAGGVRYQAVDVDPLASLPVIQDLRAMLAALLSTRDRLAWLSMLRAPWNGLTLDQLEWLCRRAGKGSLWAALPEALAADSTLDAGARERVRRTQEIFAEALRWRGRLPLVQILRDVWQQSGAAAYHGGARSRMAADAFLQALQQVEEGELLASLKPLDDAVAELQAPPDPEAPATLQLLTIHKAKGLEFDVVFLPGLQRKPRSGDGAALLWDEVVLDGEQSGQSLAVLLAPSAAPGEGASSIYRWIGKRKSQREANEDLRVLYVGFTRAREELHLLATLDPAKCKSAADLKAPPRSYLARLWDSFAPSFQQRWGERDATVERESKGFPPLRRMDVAALPVLATPAERRAVTAVGGSERFFRPVGNFETLDTAAGTVFHQLMQRVDASRWQQAGAAAERLRPLVLEELRALLPGELLPETVAERVLTAFRRATQSSVAREFFLPTHREVASEQSVSYFDGGALRAARIDRMYRDAEGRLHVVDFKLSDDAAEDREAFRAMQRRQYQSQLETYGRLLQQERAEQVQLTLYYPLQDLADTWTLEPQAATA